MKTLEELVAECRKLGIAKISTDTLDHGPVDITLGPVPQEAQPQVDNRAEVKKVLVKEGVRGRDGLTAEEQLEMYGVVHDAIPPEYEEK